MIGLAKCSPVKVALLGVGLVLGFLSASASATTVGVAVAGIGSNTQVGNTEIRSALGNQEAIEYFIPLRNLGSSCTFGVNCGTSSDKGRGGTTLSMFLRFDPVSTVNPSTLNILFEDLDLAGVNDPSNFLENINIFDADGNSLTGLIDDISNLLVEGDSTSQELNLSLGVLGESPLFLELQFVAEARQRSKNTPEYLRATVTAVPVPAAAYLFGSAFIALVGASRRRKLEA